LKYPQINLKEELPMDNNIIKIDEENLKNDLKGVIRKTIEETLNTIWG
jgi:hypothetical protein